MYVSYVQMVYVQFTSLVCTKNLQSNILVTSRVPIFCIQCRPDPPPKIYYLYCKWAQQEECEALEKYASEQRFTKSIIIIQSVHLSYLIFDSNMNLYSSEILHAPTSFFCHPMNFFNFLSSCIACSIKMYLPQKNTFFA